ncbi:hypothetical protein [Serratia liquefaciens]|uniref:hypothetical protein n=1 Tax=Serratia liquefaciens TaxID=614 RepID=UPI001F5C9208|nr:hypothetical protein [Serratia liquefaciens]
MTEQELYDHAVSLLAKKNYASGEMHRQLSRLTESTGDITRVLRRLTDNHALNDTQLLAYLFDKHVKKMHGPTRINKRCVRKDFRRHS